MKDREVLGSFTDPDGNVHQIQGSVWAPPKELISVADRLILCKSDPDKSTRGMTQFALRRRLGDEDLLRVDLYDNGYKGKYISSYWDSAVSLPNFLDLTETYFANFEDYLASQDRQMALFLLAAGRCLDAFEFGRPLNEEIFRQDPQVAEDMDTNRIHLVRMETPVGDFCWMPPNQLVGYISPANFPLQERLVDSLTQFIAETQTEISQQAAQTTLETVFQ